MILRIVLYLLIMTAGWYLSHSGIIGKRIIRKIDRIQMGFIFVLIFIMGLRLGMNEKAVASINTIGFRSLVFSVFTLVFSAAMVFMAEKFFISKRGVDI